MLSRISWLVAIPAVVALIVVAAACGDDDDAGANSDLTARIEALEQREQRAEVLGAANTLSATGFHDIDEGLQRASEIPAGTAASIEKALQVTSSTGWPEPLAAQAATLETALVDLGTALEDEDLAAAKGMSAEAHQAWHDMEHDVWAWIAGEAAPAEEDADHEDNSAPTEQASPEMSGMH